jgi:ABC-2 type transport system ATP-binding protein
MSIHVEGISKYYGSQAALKGVSFEANKGEIVGFLGPNGAGKSTLMKILTGFISASEGKARICGMEVNPADTQFRHKIGYLPETNALYTEMYVREYLRYTAGMYGLSNIASRVEEVIELTRLGKESNKKIQQLSKGYKQRVGLAAAIIHKPEVLILDEPTSGFDPNQMVDIRKLIIEAGKDKTVLLSTHIMKEVELMCSRVLIIRDGELVADDAIGQLKKSSLRKQTVIQLELSSDVDVEEIRKINGVRAARKVKSGLFLVESEAELDVRASLFHWAVECKLTVLSLSIIERELEQVFRELTSKNQ